MHYFYSADDPRIYERLLTLIENRFCTNKHKGFSELKGQYQLIYFLLEKIITSTPISYKGGR